MSKEAMFSHELARFSRMRVAGLTRPFLTVFSLIVCLLACSGLVAEAGEPSTGSTVPAGSIVVEINGQVQTMDVPPEIQNGRTMVPIRFIAEGLGARVDWIESTRQVSILRRGVERVVLQIGSGQAWIQSAVVPLDAPPYLRNGRTMLPLRFISEAFGAEVHWNEQARRVTILDAPSKETAGEDVHQGAPQPGSEEPDPGEVPNAGNDKVVRISEIRHRMEKNREIVGILGEHLTGGVVFSLHAPHRIVLDFPGGEVADGVNNFSPPRGSLIREVRFGEPEPGIARVVVELAQPAYWTQVRGDEEILLTISETPPPLADLHVVIDPGHGLSDPGAIGPSGVKEKDLNLQVAILVAERLRALQAQVTLTREADRTVDLYARPEMANRIGADLFLSIHHNAASSPTVAGTETYYARTRPADREFAEVIHQSLLTVVPGPDREVRPANFVVLRETRMPAALIEIDFLTHPERERQLSDPAFQERVAAAIAEGIRRFWSGFRPLGGTHE